MAPRSVPQEDALRLLARTTSSVADPYRNDAGSDTEASTGRPGFRPRVGNYRLVYEVDDGKAVILVISARHRREIYER
ncbi:type II toxin-antitoxin system RelE family toxin [Nocardia testacea]|uniref:type II toxin-antitoxin system RelE family toxin n=1 Tax=Nocardia testacea TaxID=248551 RepID=UPI00058595DC